MPCPGHARHVQDRRLWRRPHGRQRLRHPGGPQVGWGTGEDRRVNRRTMVLMNSYCTDLYLVIS